MERKFWNVIHNLIAHPLLLTGAKSAEKFHDWTAEKMMAKDELMITKPPISGSATDLEVDLYNLVNDYVKAGLKKSDLVHTMQYVTESCRVS